METYQEMQTINVRHSKVTGNVNNSVYINLTSGCLYTKKMTSYNRKQFIQRIVDRETGNQIIK